MTASESLRYKDIIQDYEISDRIDYLAFLDSEDESDLGFWEDEIEELKALRKLQEETGGDTSGLVSEDYWEEYAVNDANELHDLKKNGLDVYFDYAKYAEDLQTVYSQAQFLGTTYYYR